MQSKHIHDQIPFALNIAFYTTNFFIALGFILKGSFNQIANPISTSLFFLLLLLLDRYTKFELNGLTRVLVMITLISHSLFGEYLRAYYTTGYFDNLLHFFGTFSFALLSYEVFLTFIKVRSSLPALFIILLVSFLGISLGTFFELLEFALDRLLHERNQFGLIDTDLDLLFDVVGAFCAGIFIAIKNASFTRLR